MLIFPVTYSHSLESEYKKNSKMPSMSNLQNKIMTPQTQKEDNLWAFLPKK